MLVVVVSWILDEFTTEVTSKELKECSSWLFFQYLLGVGAVELVLDVLPMVVASKR